MSDLISRQDAIDTAVTFARRTLLDSKPIDVKMSSDYIFVNLVEPMRKLPTAQPERKAGKWVTVHGYCTPGGDPVWACSECGKGIHVYGIEHGSYGRDVSDGQWKACPNCGCKMEGEEHD